MIRARAGKLAGGCGQVFAVIATMAVAAFSGLWLFAAELAPSPGLTLAPLGVFASEPVTPVSDIFRRRVEDTASALPDCIWQSLGQAGWQVQLAEFVVDAAPALTDSRPRGWPAGLTWQNTDAVNLPQQRLVIVAEKRRNRQGKIVSSDRIEGVFRHELGHAYDSAVGGKWRCESAQPEFLAAYHGDLSAIVAEQRSELDYYLQDSDAGRQEAYAEAFAILLGGGSDPDKREVFLHAFPRVMAHLKKSLAARQTAMQTAAAVKE